MFIAQTLSETCFDDEAQLHRTQVARISCVEVTQSRFEKDSRRRDGDELEAIDVKG